MSSVDTPPTLPSLHSNTHQQRSSTTCCCGSCSIVTGVYIVSSVGFLIEFCIIVLTHIFWNTPTMAFYHWCFAGLYAMAFVAQHMQNRTLYTIFLAIVGIALVVGAILSFFTVLSIFLQGPLSVLWIVFFASELSMLYSQLGNPATAFFVFLATFAVYFVIHMWFYTVIYRGYKELKRSFIPVF